MKTETEGCILSVIVPMFNVESYISRCLDSLLKQDIENYEIIIINDGSTDKSLNIAREYQQKSKKIKILDQKNQGQSIARNNGVKHAEGQYIMFVDSDDYVVENSLNGILNKIVDNDLDLAGFEYRILEGNKLEDRNNSNTVYETHLTPGKFITNGLSMLPAWFVIIRRDVMLKNEFKFKQGIYHEDLELLPRVIFACTNLMMFSDQVYIYVKRENSSLSNKQQQNLKKVSLDQFTVAIELHNFFKDIVLSDTERMYIYKHYINNAVEFGLGRILFGYFSVSIPEIKTIRKKLKEEGILPLNDAESKLTNPLFKIINSDLLYSIFVIIPLFNFYRKIVKK